MPIKDVKSLKGKAQYAAGYAVGKAKQQNKWLNPQYLKGRVAGKVEQIKKKLTKEDTEVQTPGQPSLTDLINQYVDQKPSEFADTFNELIRARVASQVADKKLEMQQALFGAPPLEPNEDDDEQETPDTEDDSDDDNDSEDDEETSTSSD